MRFSIVTGVELVKVNDPAALFAAAAEAGIPFMETAAGMIWTDDGPVIRVETTRRIPKDRRKAVKGTPLDTPAARAGRVLRGANVYAAIPAAFDDSLPDPGWSPTDPE
jgi:hypothetical protein